MNQRFFTVWRPAAAVAVVLCLLPAASSAQGFKWWQSDKFQRELELSADQIARIDAIFDAYLPEARTQKRVLDQLEDQLEELIDTSEDEATVMSHADQVESVRSELSKARTRMLVRIRNVLTSDQRVTLAALHEEWERSRRRDRRQ
jgi:Spy/CpxP family protein refolding chaperone